MLKPWCTCKPERVSGWVLDVESNHWVHSVCRKPSRLYYKMIIGTSNPYREIFEEEERHWNSLP